MSNLKVTLYKQGKLETTVTIPGKVLKVANKLIPKQIIDVLAQEGVDFNEILQLATKPELSGKLMELEQHGKNLKVEILLD